MIESFEIFDKGNEYLDDDFKPWLHIDDESLINLKKFMDLDHIVELGPALISEKLSNNTKVALHTMNKLNRLGRAIIIGENTEIVHGYKTEIGDKVLIDNSWIDGFRIVGSIVIDCEYLDLRPGYDIDRVKPLIMDRNLYKEVIHFT